MRTARLIKCFLWREQDRDIVTLGPNTRINPRTNRAQIKDVGGVHSTALDLVVKSKLTALRAVRRWSGFEARVINALNDLGEPLTGARFRLDNGTTEFFWDGAAWVATTTGWNTEQEIADNIASFDAITVGARKMRVVVNLFTADARYTPQLEWVKLVHESVIEFQEDIVYRSLIPLMRASIRPIANADFNMPAAGTTFPITALGLETGYNLVGVDAVFDYDANPQAAMEGWAPNILASFASGIVTLTAAQPLNRKLYVRFVYEPEVAVTTSQDFIEQAKLPAIVLTDIAMVDASEAADGEDSVTNKGLGTAVVVPSPQQGDLTITLIGMTALAIDHQRLLERINAFFYNTPFVVSSGLDEAYRLHLIDEYAAVGEPSQEETHAGRAIFRIKNFRRWLKEAFDDFAVQGVVSGAGGNLRI